MLRRRRKKWNLLLTFVSLSRDSFLLMSLTIWTNEIFAPAALQLLEKGTSGHRLLSAPRASASVLNAGASDPGFALVDVAFGQPSLADCFENKRLKWVEVSSAGYTRYDTEEFGAAFRARGAAFTNASGVFADPCAQHVLSMMLAFARQILPSYRDQITDHSWHYDERRYHSRLLTGQTGYSSGLERSDAALQNCWRPSVFGYLPTGAALLRRRAWKLWVRKHSPER